MGKRTKAPAPASTPESPTRYTILAVLAAFTTGWSAFLWRELVKARESGADPFCAFGDAGACGALWDAPFAATIHRMTGVPVAGWGVVWGLAALALPILLLISKEGLPRKKLQRRLGALRLLALLALVGVVILLAASFAAGIFCSSCAIIYVVAGLYGILGLFSESSKQASYGVGVPTAAGFLLMGFLVALYPGLQTPRGQADAERQAVADAIENGASESQRLDSQRPESQRMPAWLAAGNGTGDPARDRQLRQLIGSLSAPMRQGMADSLWAYANAPALPAEAPRRVEGPSQAPVRIVEFTDTLCTHCASLHETFEYLRTVVDEESFSVERRHYPLDGNCNADITVRGPETVRCLAARAKICLEGKDGYEEVTEALYRDQLSLTPAMVFSATDPYIAQAQLEACVASPETEQKLAADVAYAARFNPGGTPLVLVNGREATSFAPFLYAMALTGGEFSHPAFAGLPAPQAR